MSQQLDDLDDLFPDTVSWEQTLTVDGRGKVLTKAAAVDIDAYVYGKVELIRDSEGRLQTSTVRAVLQGAFGVQARDTFTLPARFVPRSPKALAVAQRTAEEGAHHETVYFR